MYPGGWTLFASRKNSFDNTDRQLITIDPETGVGSLVMDLDKRFTALARGPGGLLWATRMDNDVWTINVETGEQTLIGSNPYRRLEALEYAFGDYDPKIEVPGVPSAWTDDGILFSFSDTDDALLILNPEDGAAIEYQCSFNTIDCEGMVFVTKRTDIFGQVTAGFD